MAFIALCACACADDASPPVATVTQPILGGATAKAGEFPAVVVIVVNGSPLCAGVLITPKTILSAARCFDAADAGLADLPAVAAVTRVHIGIEDVNALTSPGAEVSSIRLAPLTGLTPTDLSLLELKSAATVIPAPVNTRSDLVPAGAALTLVGYGASRTLGGAPDRGSVGILRSVTSVNHNCASFAYPTRMLCFNLSNGPGACGDTGGPSFVAVNGTLLVAGIHSFNDAACNQYSVDFRVDTELSFIGPALCAADGFCASSCGTNSLQVDPDCESSHDAGVGGGRPGDAGSPGSGATLGNGGIGTGSGGVSNTGGPPSAGAGGTPQAGAGGTPQGKGTAGNATAGAGGTSPTTDGGTTSNMAGSKSSGASGGCGCRLSQNASSGERRLPAAVAVAVALGLGARRRRERTGLRPRRRA